MAGDGTVYYQCQRCTRCCRWPGFVNIDSVEIAKIAACLRLSEFDFIQRFTRLQAARHGLALMDKSNGECIFLDGCNCTIRPVKPRQCRDFPNQWNFPGWRDVCGAIPVPAEARPPTRDTPADLPGRR